MRRSGFRIFAACLVAVALSGLALGRPSFVAAATPVGTFAGCPLGVEPLLGTVASYASAARSTALSFVHSHASRLKLKDAGARANRVLRVTGWLPSGWIKTECGSIVWERSLAVGVFFPAMNPAHNPVGPCASCASVTYLISKLRRGWVVWGNY
jgi:hypothetical protein